MQRLAHRLEDQPLMRGMLVDDDKAVLGLRDDVVFVDLRPGGAERITRRRFGARRGLLQVCACGSARAAGMPVRRRMPAAVSPKPPVAA